MTDDLRPPLGLNLPTWPLHGGGYASWPEMRQLARDVEALGIETLWVPDHLQRSLPNRPAIGFRECWTILAATAEATSRIGIGPFVSSAGYRNPGLLAKMAATLDEVAGGRLILGIGSGDPAHDDSWRMFGFDAERHVSRFAEAVEIVARLLREPPVTFRGEHYRTEDADIVPRGPRARIPLWVAGKGERTLEIAARWADAVNVNVALAGAADALSVTVRVADACRRVGRDPATLAVTGWGRLSLGADGAATRRDGWIGGTPAEVAADIRSIGAAGLAHLTLYLGADGDPSPLPALTRDTLDRFAPVLEALEAR